MVYLVTFVLSIYNNSLHFIMRSIFIISILCILIQGILVSCTSANNDEPKIHVVEEAEMNKSDVAIEKDSLILNLQNLNDSLILSAKVNDTRGLRDIFRALNFVAIIAADIRGAVNGAKWGSRIGGWIGGVIGAAILGVGYSSLAGMCTSAPLDAPIRYNLAQENVELAYASVLADSQLSVKRDFECRNINIYIPKEYSNSFEVGVYHNLTLKALEENKPINVDINQHLSKEQIDIIHSVEFRSQYNQIFVKPEIISLDHMIQNATKEDRIIQMFVDVYKQYPTDMFDVNYIINKYIELIEKDSQITPLEKEAVYSALSTAAFSSDYWAQRIVY